MFGRSFTQRLVTQMYFPGDPSSPTTPSTAPSPTRRPANAYARFDLAATQPEWALGYRFDVVVGGRAATPPDPDDDP